MDKEESLRREAIALEVAKNVMEKHSAAFKELAQIETIERLIEQDNARKELEVVKHRNIENLALDRTTNYEMRFGVKGLNEHLMYMSSSYYGTGEGQTVCLMVTQALPTALDFNRDGPSPDIPINTKAYRAVREFMDTFGTWHCHGLDFHTQDDFYNEYGQYLPPIMDRLRKSRCYMNFHTEVHFNFS